MNQRIRTSRERDTVNKEEHMNRLKVLMCTCLLSALALVWAGGQALAQPQVILRPRKSHDIEYVKQRMAMRVTTEQRMAAAARRAAANGQATSGANGAASGNGGSNNNGGGNK